MGMLLHRHRADKEPEKVEKSIFEQDEKKKEPAKKPGRPKKQ